MTFTQAEYTERMEKFQGLLREREADLALLNWNADLFYYTGSVNPLYLIVPAQGEPVVLARKAVEQIRRDVPHMRLETFYGTKDLIAVLESLGLGRGKVKKAGYTLDNTSYSTVSRFQGILGNPEIVDLSWDIRPLRTVKSESEIAIQRRAGQVMAKVPELVRENFRPGMTEIELSVVLEDYFRLHGHAGIIRCRREGIEISGQGVLSSGENMLTGTKFDGICAGTGLGPSAPHGAGETPIPKGVPVIIDFGYNLEGYHIDLTRMFSWGAPSDEVKKAYDAMVRVEDWIIENMLPGKSWEDIYNGALELAVRLGYEEQFMGLGPEKVRFVGHGVGVELDEPPFLAPKMTYTLEAGMVAAVEPKVAIAGVGVIGPEDTLVVREGGPEMITTCDREWIVV